MLLLTTIVLLLKLRQEGGTCSVLSTRVSCSCCPVHRLFMAKKNLPNDMFSDLKQFQVLQVSILSRFLVCMVFNNSYVLAGKFSHPVTDI